MIRKPNKKFRILALDGGGIRGIISAAILQRLCITYPNFLERIDLIAGTSTGGLLALGLASGLSPDQLVNLYENFGPSIFQDNLFDDISDFGNLLGAEYEIEPLKEALKSHFGDMTLAQLDKRVLISAFNLDNEDQIAYQRKWKTKFFHNFAIEGSDGHESVVDVAIMTAAAPTYFPIYQGYIDGGVVANNPSMCALAQALSLDTKKTKLQDVVLFSIGTGRNPRYLEVKNGDWGIVQWARYIVDLVLEGSVDLVDYQCNQILGNHYFRSNVILPEAINMDEYERIPTLKRIARQYDLASAVQWLNEYF